MPIPIIDSQYLINFLIRLLNTPSPTGYTYRAINLLQETLESFSELTLKQSLKGALLATWPGQHAEHPRGITAHVDTLGAMVKEIKSNGRLKLTQIGGYSWNSVEGEGVTVFTQSGKSIRGAFLLCNASTHIHGRQNKDTPRDENTMEVRLDELTTSREETLAAGIEVGDFVAFDPRVEFTNGFIRSRHLDDKACVACVLAALKAIREASLQPTRTTHFLFSNYEEVGHGGAAGFPPELEELLVVDMAAVGEGQTSDEFNVSICVKDSGGPYHYGFSQRLRQLAKTENIPHKIDIYPYYGSDGEALWRAGADIQVALVGPGIDASHNYERTHLDALVATTRWIIAYLLN